jgi:hypothetical protein
MIPFTGLRPLVFGTSALLLLSHCGGRSSEDCQPDGSHQAGDGPGAGGSGSGAMGSGGEAANATGGTGRHPDALPYLDGSDAATFFAPAFSEETGPWCPVNLPDQTETIVTLVDRPEADGDTLRLGVEFCGATNIAWEEAGRTRFERYWSEGGTALSYSNPPGQLADLTMSRTGAALLTTYDAAGQPTFVVLRPDKSAFEGPPAGTAWGAFPLVEFWDGRWFDPVLRRDVVKLPSLEPAVSPSDSLIMSDAPLRYAHARTALLGGPVVVTAKKPDDYGSSDVGIFTINTDRSGEQVNTTTAPGWPVWAMTVDTGPNDPSPNAIVGLSRRQFSDVSSDRELMTLSWNSDSGSGCETSVMSQYPYSWRWVAPRCDLLIGVYGVKYGYLVVHFERRDDEKWIPHLTLLGSAGTEFATASLEDEIPELNPSGNLRWWEFGATVASAVHLASTQQFEPFRQRLVLGGYRADGGGLWVGRIRWWDFVQCPASSGDFPYDCNEFD